MNQRSRYRGSRNRSKDGVSEVIGTILTVGITVILFSGIALYVGTMPQPKGSTSTSFSGQSVLLSNGNAIVNITQMGGQVLDKGDTYVLLTAGGATFGPFTLAQGEIFQDWAPGLTWTRTVNVGSTSSGLQATIYQQSVGDVIWQGMVSDASPSSIPTIISRGIWDGYGTYNSPIYISTPVHFYVRFSPSQAMGNLDIYSVKVDVSKIVSATDPQEKDLIVSPTNMFFYETDTDTTALLAWSGKTVTFSFDYYTTTDHSPTGPTQKIYVPATLQVLKNSNGNGNGNGTNSGNPPQNINYSALQGFNIFEKADWDANEYNATPRINFANTEKAVVVVASQYLVNVMGKNDLGVMNSATGIVYPSVSSPANIFSTYAYYAGHYIYTATIDFSKVDPDQFYSLSIGLKDTWNPQHSMIATTQVRVGGESTQLYPVFETFADPAYTIPSDTFSMNDKIYVQVKTRNGYSWDAYGGSVMIRDYFGGTQVNRAPELPAASTGYVCTVTSGEATIISYSGPGGELIIPATLGGYPVVAIGNTAFQNHADISSVTIPEFVTSIGTSAFRGCTGMDWITIGANVTSIGKYSFEGCVGLNLITFLGRTAPTLPEGNQNWIDNTPTTIRGQALATSSFLPNSDSNHRWNDLQMGVLMPIDKNPVSTVAQLTGGNSNTYRFNIDLSLADQKPWISGQNHYTLNYDTFKTATTGHQEQYYLAKVIYVSGPFQTLDIVTSGASVGDHHRHLADSNNAVQYYLNDDDWQDPYAVATYVDDYRPHNWKAPEGSMATIGDINGDGKADIIAILYDNADRKETETSLNIYINDGTDTWARSIIAMLPYGAVPTALTVGNADLDGDLDIFVAYSFPIHRHHSNPNAVGSVGVYINDGAWTYEEITNSNYPIKYMSVGDLDVNQGSNIPGCALDVLIGYDKAGTGGSGAFILFRNYNNMGHDWAAVTITFSDASSPYEAGGVKIVDMDSTWKNEIVLMDKWQQVWIGTYDLSTNTATAAMIPATAHASNPSPTNTIAYGLGTGIIIGERGERLQDVVLTMSSWIKVGSKVYMTTIDITVLNQISVNTFSKVNLADEIFYFNEDHHSPRERTNPTTTVVADIDGNGLSDILLGGSDGEIRYLKNIKATTDASSWVPIQVDMGSEGFGWTRTTVVSSLSVGNIHGGTTIGPVVVPGVPDLAATPGNVKVTLTWSGPAIDGGSPITYYKVYKSTTSTGTYTMISSFSGGVQSYIDTDVINGQTYWYKISAVNAMGEGAQCAPVSATPGPTIPSAPTNLAASASNGQIVLTWVAPTDDGGSPISYYVIYQNGVALPAHPVGLTTTITGLVNGQSYSFTVAAHNSVGNSPQSTSTSATPVGLPTAPQNPLAVNTKNKEITISWQAPASNGGSPIIRYNIYRYNSVGTLEATYTSTGLSYRNTGLVDGRGYWYKVSAVTAIGEGPLSTDASAIA